MAIFARLPVEQVRLCVGRCTSYPPMSSRGDAQASSPESILTTEHLVEWIPGLAPSKSAVADLDKQHSRTRVNPSSGGASRNDEPEGFQTLQTSSSAKADHPVPPPPSVSIRRLCDTACPH